MPSLSPLAAELLTVLSPTPSRLTDVEEDLRVQFPQLRKAIRELHQAGYLIKTHKFRGRGICLSVAPEAWPRFYDAGNRAWDASN